MAIDNPTDVITHNNQNITEIINNSNNSIKNTIGAITFNTLDINAFERNFAGMDSDNISAFETAVDTYRDNIQSIVNGFNAEADMEAALKGSVASAFHDFLLSVKTLLNKYIAAIDIEKKEVQEANQNYLRAASMIAGDVASDSDSIRSQSNGVSID